MRKCRVPGQQIKIMVIPLLGMCVWLCKGVHMCTCAHVRVLVLMCVRVCVHINVALVRVRVRVRVPVRMCVHARACEHLSTGMSVCPYARRPRARAQARVHTRICKSTSTMMCTRVHSRS